MGSVTMHLPRRFDLSLMHATLRGSDQTSTLSQRGKFFYLPDDLVPYILEQLSLDHWSVATLSRISSYWLKCARRVLYVSPKPQTYHSCYLLSRTLSDHPELGDLIRHLSLRPSSNTCAIHRCECRNAAALSLAPLFRLSKLESISLKGDCAIHADWYLTNLLYPQNIQEIHIDGMQWSWVLADDLTLSACLRWTDTLSFRFANLKSLSLANLILRVRPPRAFKPRPPHLMQLHLDRVRIVEGSMSDLAPSAWDTLQDLSIVVHEYSSAYDLQTVLPEASNSLKSLKYIITEPKPEHDLSLIVGDNNLASCTALTSLELSLFFSSSSLDRLGHHLTRLEHLKVNRNDELSVDHWEKAILGGYFQNLRELHVPVDDELRNLAGWQWPSHYSSIAEACMNRRIALQFAYPLP